MGDEGRWEIRTHADEAVELIVHDLDDEDAMASGYTALASLYPGWVQTDAGCYGETGFFEVYQPAEMPQEEESG